MYEARPFAVPLLAATSLLVLGLAVSYRPNRQPPPRLEFTWSAPSAAPAIQKPLVAAPAPPRAPSRVERAKPRVPVSVPHDAQPNLSPPTRTEVARVEERLKDNLTQELHDDFKLFLYVSKAPSGPWAQQMYVFRKKRDGDLAFAYDWPVSTGRERTEYAASGERMTTHTPAGYYELDPDRFFVHHTSSEWHRPMPYAMFFNWIRNGSATGLAIHSATGSDVAKLGHRASAGCIHLSPEAARTLFYLIRSQYRGAVPRFAIDTNGTMSNDGLVLRDAGGRAQFARGYKVLVFIEDYGGRNVIAAMD
ncbi:MAG TPA: L,D-transpeptidase [Rhizomicrobium sp.]|jgi:lipoprotein-anchoring transpeptidase ErfK/SrfK|nr:L,D-transpeptidase [Rhizomicrobium sp.]